MAFMHFAWEITLHAFFEDKMGKNHPNNFSFILNDKIRNFLQNTWTTISLL